MNLRPLERHERRDGPAPGPPVSARWIVPLLFAYGLSTSGLFAQCPPAPPSDLVLPNSACPATGYVSGIYAFQAGNSVTTSGTLTVSGSANVSVQAQNVIKLEPGFHATAGSGATFHAFIAPLPISVSTPAPPLPTGEIYVNYSPMAFGASGGSGSYSWTATGVPAGLTLSSSGMLSGMPTTTGNFPVSVQATDNVLGSRATQSYPLLVQASPQSISVTTTTATQNYTYNDGITRSSNYCLGPAGGGCYSSGHSQYLTACSVSGLSLSISIIPNGRDSVYFSLGYQAGTSAPPGSGQLKCIYYPDGGAADQVTLTGPTISIFDATPQISSVTPNSIAQGTTPVAVTFRGVGFGLAAPTLNISPTLPYSIAAGNSPTAFIAQITPATSGSYSITAQSKGNGPSGNFQAGGNPSSQSQSAAVQLNISASPSIIIAPDTACATGANVAGTTVTVYVGQQIALTGWPTAGAQISSRSWSQPSGTAIGGYQASTASGSVTALPALDTDGLTFYWVDSGNARQMTYTDTLSNGQTVSAIVTFNVVGPTAPNITATAGVVQLLPISGNAVAQGGTPTMLLNGVQFNGGQVGIKLQGSSVLPQNNPGVYSWVQLLSPPDYKILTSTGAQQCTAFAGQAQLDNSYPYGVPGQSLFTTNIQNDTVTDGPRLGLASKGVNFVEGKEYFAAIMYLLWTSGTPNSIPVPLANLSWNWAGDAINTLTPQGNAPNTTFTLGCGNGTANTCHVTIPAMEANQGYPTWQATFTNGTLSCQPL